MIKTAVIGDPHLSDVPRDLYRDHMFRDLPNVLAKMNVAQTIILGDLTDAKDRHSGRLVNMIVQHIVALRALGSVLILKGNHDYESPDNPFFEFLSHIPNVTYIVNPCRVRVPGVGWAQFLPHTYNYKRDWKGLKFRKDDICFAHNTFQGANLGHKLADDGIPEDVLPHERIICGDVHEPQKVGRFIYVGAPYTVDFGDDYQPRMMLINNGSIISKNLYGSQKALIEANGFGDLDKALERSGAQRGDIVKIRLKVKSWSMDEWGRLSEDARRWANKKGLIVHAVQPRVTEADSPDKKQTRVKRDQRSDKDAVIDYADKHFVNDKTLDVGVRLIK